MASWIIHFRIADALLDRFTCLSPVEFVFGNVAPDSGVPNPDGVTYTPSAEASHFKTRGKDGRSAVNPKLFTAHVLSAVDKKSYTNKSLSFYLGYLSHLLTDVLWAEKIQKPTVERFISDYLANKLSFLWIMKKDWYDLDFRFIKNNPSLKAFELYKSCPAFENVYINLFPPDAFTLKQREIVSFYSQERHDLDREYVYLSKEKYDLFVTEAIEKIACVLKEYLK